ncbi:MAG TPA: sulfite exporter TauE/SafE family protein [Woeseiaceae bacterium]|nr:sulfite exporter TauE/SafE family protein [Woeseiaceae bacterium]
MTLITDPWFYAAAVPAVLAFGISKGGFGGGLGTLAVPLMALVISPVQAAGILLPILCLMDLLSLWAYRGKWIWVEVRILVPASLIGILAGTLLFDYMSSAMIRLMIGVVALTFTLHYWISKNRNYGEALPNYPRSVGIPAGAVAGLTSFVAHSGGPPLSMYLLRRPMDRTDFVATSVLFFAVVNYTKLIPYAWLGQLDSTNLATSVILAPLAPLGIMIGVYLHKRVSDRFFFAFVYLLLAAVGVKLIWDGLVNL